MAVEHIDHTGGRISAIAQGSGAFQHFNSLRVKQRNAICMVAAGRGNIANAHAIAEHINAIAAKTANKRLADSRAETGAIDTGQAGQGVANRSVERGLQRVGSNHFSCRDNLIGGSLIGRAEHNDFIYALGECERAAKASGAEQHGGAIHGFHDKSSELK